MPNICKILMGVENRDSYLLDFGLLHFCPPILWAETLNCSQFFFFLMHQQDTAKRKERIIAFCKNIASDGSG